ncbi:hypothetical protein IQ276_038750 [Desmonostoc muscorum LEGE 12446]|uniref:putative quinol monooxygenase n=1 Tax=Desmonostoc muscorum TaxID=1179 RepID=UPI001D14E59C|nr:hypothetical protein [Desmonostoc muscorum]MCF2152227.1 hypothetical protein [Desmonostoc muscorum LEGE 12446]
MSIPKNKRFLSLTRRHVLKLLGISASFGAGVMLPSSLRAATPLKGDEQISTEKESVNHQSKKRVNVGVLARFEAKPGKEAELESLLRKGLAMVEKEPATTQWYAIKIGPTTYGIFDVFPDEAGRQAHFDGKFTALLFSKLPELQALEPKIELIDVVATTLGRKHVSKETKKRVNVGVLARFEAKPGKEAELESLLRNGVALVEKEPATTEWFAIKIAPTTYGIFDVFPDEAGRQAHFDGEFTALLFSKLPELQALQPKIELIDVVATTINKKIPIWD